MIQELCPYPGLRPFEENESIFFKGREKHIKEIIRQLESRHFVMITGASGDGKSSIVYAGVIPNIKAGFIKANYNAWRFGVIKPEDHPLKNLCNAIAKMLSMDEKYVYDELSLGFSSIVDLYTQSELYVDQESDEWMDATLEEKKAKRSKAANFFILIDQFEEFFTNSDNFQNGEPTEEAEVVINLMVETVRLANERKLPIYIVFTMRSDFIGNCPAFRGLPELIGYSHFFIPRLNREEIEKIILEPALLNGDNITESLVNHLSAEATEGRDQLPIIQHALNRIWNIAKVKNEEMDLIHLAMAGGIDLMELPNKDQSTFQKFKQNLPDYQQSFYENPSLQNVINSHADDLMIKTIQKAEKKWNGKWTSLELKEAFKRTFQTLTKIDSGRSVRHRASINEMVGTVHISGFGPNEISFLLSQFRSEGNHLVFPFEHQLQELNGKDVLDITHEALIRNWDNLRIWTEENQENLADYNDINKQLIRWKESNCSSTFLLSLGPLEQFEKWYEQSRINAYWLVKYDESSFSSEDKLQIATKKVKDIEDYLLKSREHVAALMAARRRRVRILAMASLLIILVLSGISFWAFDQKNFASAQKNIAEQKREESDKAKKSAEQAKEEAEQSKLLAETKEKEARLSQSESEKSAEQALKQKSIADAATIFANTQTNKAKAEAIRANQEFENANKQRTLAEAAQQKAITSEAQTKILSDKAFSQTLAYMATEKYDAVDWSAIFALHALDIHDQINNGVNDQVIFNGLIQGAYNLSGDYFFDLKTTTPRIGQPYEQIVLIPEGNTFYSLGMDGIIDLWDIALNDRIKSDILWGDNVGTLVYLHHDQNSGLLFRQNPDGGIFIYEKKENRFTLKKSFKGFKGILKGATYFSESKKYLFVGKDGKFYFIGEEELPTWKGKSIEDEIISFASLDNGVILGGRSGKIWLLKSEGEFENIHVDADKKLIPYAITAGGNNNFYAGLSNGKILHFQKTGDDWKMSKEYVVKKIMVKGLYYEPSQQTLAAVYSDNSVSVHNFSNPKNKPYSLAFKTKIKSQMVSKSGHLILTMSDYSVKSIPLLTKDLYERLCEEIVDDLTPAKWEEIFGKEYPFQTIKCK